MRRGHFFRKLFGTDAEVSRFELFQTIDDFGDTGLNKQTVSVSLHFHNRQA